LLAVRGCRILKSIYFKEGSRSARVRVNYLVTFHFLATSPAGDVAKKETKRKVGVDNKNQEKE